MAEKEEFICEGVFRHPFNDDDDDDDDDDNGALIAPTSKGVNKKFFCGLETLLLVLF
jgi:hypothetical protein